MVKKIRIAYIDKDEGWQSTAYALLSKDFNLYIPGGLPANIEDIWKMISVFKAQAVLIDYGLNNSGIVPYTGLDMIDVIAKHNKNLPAFLITADKYHTQLMCDESQIILGKESFTNKDEYQHLISVLMSHISPYIVI